MRRLNDYLIIILLCAMTLGLVTAIAVTLGYSIKASSKDYEIKKIKEEYLEDINARSVETRAELVEVKKQVESSAYLNQRRYELLNQELRELRSDLKRRK
jgi:hypothetical protein